MHHLLTLTVGDPSVVKMMPPQPYSLSWGETEEEITSKYPLCLR